MNHRTYNWLISAMLSLLMGCSSSAVLPNSPTLINSGAITFRSQDLPFSYERGETGSAWPVEVTGGGVGLLDFDGDGDLDLFFCQGGPLQPSENKPPMADVLLRNDGKGQFVDVSREAGLAPKGYGQGVVVADYDGDGDPDVYVTRYGKNTLWRNNNGKFIDATDFAHVGLSLWSLGAAFLDFDGDGDLDLFVTTYMEFDPKAAPFAFDHETGKANYGVPSDFVGQADVLYRNNGDGKFTDVTEISRITGNERGMGCLAADFDRDGRIDILVANDAQPNVLWRNKGDGTFEDVAHKWGIAYNGDGKVEANMGIAHGDLDGDGLLDILISHYYNEHATLWRASATSNGTFYQDVTYECGLVLDSRPTTGWGIADADFDADGRLDVIITNGQIRKEHGQAYPYENPPILWRNLGLNRFQNVIGTAGDYFKKLHQGRGSQPATWMETAIWTWSSCTTISRASPSGTKP